MLMVNVLGPLVITVDARAIKIPKKGRALLAYLAIAGRPIERDRLADLLWPYQASEQARHSLRNCLMEVRKHLGPERDRLHATFTTCSLEAQTDLQRLRQLAEAGGLNALGQAAGLIRGELLENGLAITSEPWDDWLTGERERTLPALSTALTKYSEAASQAGRHDQAVAVARQLVSLDNLNEDSHRHLMRILAAAGQRGTAVRQFTKLHKLLQDELGVPPDPASCELRNQLARTEVDVETALPAPPTIRIVPAEPVPDNPLTLQLERLVAEIRSWKSGVARLTRTLIDECEKAMAAAASDRRQQAELRAVVDPPMSESVAA